MHYQTIIETTTNIFIGADELQWPLLSNSFADNVLLDYSSLSGKPAATLPAADIIKSWESIFPGFEHTHHQVSNFNVDEKNSEATVFCYGTATHYLTNDSNNNIWTVVGTYNFHLTQQNGQWKVDRMKFNFKYQDGNTGLPKLAMEKAKTSNRKAEI